MSTIKGNQVLGLPVITINNGKQLAKIQDIIYDPKTNQVKAFLISEGGWFKEAEVLLIQDIKAIGQDAVMIDSTNQIRPANEVDNAVSSIAESENYLTKNQVITQQGTKLGKVVDIYFDFPGGRVSDLEVSEGMFKNISSGTKTVPVANIITVGEEALIVSGFVENQFDKQAQHQGIQGALNSAKEGVVNAWQSTSSKAIELGEVAKDKAIEYGTVAKDKATELGSNAGAKAQEIGQNLQAKSQEVAESEKVQNAKEAVVNKFQDVKEHVQSGKAGEQAQNLASVAATRVSESFQSAKSAVTGTASDATAKATDARAHGALGKKVGNITLLTKDDKIIAEPGDTITHTIIEISEANDVLDKLLNNVV